MNLVNIFKKFTDFSKHFLFILYKNPCNFTKSIQFVTKRKFDINNAHSTKMHLFTIFYISLLNKWFIIEI